jgi:hypothetical protein
VITRILEQACDRISASEQCLGDHDKGMRNLDARCTSFAGATPQAAPTSAGAPPQAAQSVPQPGGFGADFGATFVSGAAHQPFGSQATGAAPQVEAHDIHSLHGDRPRGPWKLYDEKFLLDGKNAYDAKNPATWLEDLRDYLSGRTPELDKLFQWAELRTTEIVSFKEYDGVIETPPSAEAISQQLWALLGGLVKGDASAKRIFANVPRHNGFEVFRGSLSR